MTAPEHVRLFDRIERGAELVPRTRLFQRLETAEPAVGTYTKTAAPELVEMIGAAGFDYVVIDMMITPTDWATAANLASAAYQFNMTPWIRLQSFPWGDDDVVDTRLAADVLRALSIGFQVIQVSVDGPGPVKSALLPRRNNHRRVHLPNFSAIANSDIANSGSVEDLVEARTLIVPSIESERGLERLDEILALPGLRAAKLGMGDLVQVLGHPGDFDHPDIRAVISGLVEKMSARDQHLVVNIHGAYSPTTLSQRAEWLWKAGVPIIEIPSWVFFLNQFYNETLGMIRDRIGGSDL